MESGTGENQGEQEAVQITYLEARRQRPEEEVSMNTLLNYTGAKCGMEPLDMVDISALMSEKWWVT